LRTQTAIVIAGVLSIVAICLGASRLATTWMGRQPDGSYIVATGQRIEPGALSFDGRPIDLALHPSGEFFAVLNQNNVLLLNREGLLEKGAIALAPAGQEKFGAGYRGAVWSPDGKRLYVSVAQGHVQEFDCEGRTLTHGRKIEVKPEGAEGNPRPGGMAITGDGTRLFVAACDRNAVAEIDLKSGRFQREFKVQNLPFDVKLSADEKTLVVSNWGGRRPQDIYMAELCRQWQAEHADYQKAYWQTHPESAERNRTRQRQRDRQRRVTSLVKNNVALDLKRSAAEVWLVGPETADLVKNNVAFSEVLVFQRVASSVLESCKEQPPGPGGVLPV
jgi:DNA-binding beta-propeller fold protein YncE